MATIHPFVYYYKDQNNIKNGNCVLISDCNIHDTIAVHLFQKRLVAHLKDNFSVVQRIIYFSDGCAGQYKNLKNFINYASTSNILGLQLSGTFSQQAMAMVHQMGLVEQLSERLQ